MTAILVGDTSAVTETQWERLHRLIERRRKILGLTLAGIQTIGGPSPRWVQKLSTMEGLPTDRMRTPMRKLDRVLRWPEDTTWNLVNLDRSTWLPEVLEDEEHDLLESVDEADEIAYVIAARVRAIPAGRERDEVMRQLLEVLGIYR
jgi:hypothetical protein